MRKIAAGFLALLCFCCVSEALHAQADEPPKRRKKNAFIGFAVGISGYWPDTETLRAAFTAIEDFYRDQGFAIPPNNGFSTSPLTTYSMRIQLASPVGIVVEAAHRGGDDMVDALAATLLVELFGHTRGGLRPYLGAGVTDVSFEFTQAYNARISPVDQSGGYQTLDHVTALGSQLGANFVGGLQLEPSIHARLVVQVSYWWIPELSDDFGTGQTVTMDLSSVVVSGQMMLTFP